MTDRKTPVPTTYPELEDERELEQFLQRNAGRVGAGLYNDSVAQSRPTVPAPAGLEFEIDVDVCFDSMRVADAMVDDAAPPSEPVPSTQRSALVRATTRAWGMP